MTQATCPDARILRALLDDDGDAAEWQPHLETCARCRQTLEELAADAASWSDAARRLKRVGETPAPAAPALGQVMERFKGDEAPGATEAEPTADHELPPSFLLPADGPGMVGYLGDYVVLEVIGRGGMGVVFKAFDPALHRMTAIKVLAPQLAGSATARRRFLREGRAAAAVVHDHVITIYDVDEKDGLPYLVMQYVAGVSLQDKLDRDGPLPLAEVLRIGTQTAAGLAAAHAQGLIHRDIKPSNILLENGVERVKITDFGLARAADDERCTRTGYVVGTPAYMAPEQARGEPPDPRADLFSLGSVLFALCTGEPPFSAGSSLAMMRRVADEAPPPVRAFNPEIPEWLEEIVSQLHATDPAKRFGPAAEVAALLERHLAHLQQPAAMPKPARLAQSPSPRRPRLRRWLCVAAAVLAVVVAFGASEASGVTQVVQAVATALRITTPYGTLVVDVDDPDVKVQVDGEDLVISGAGVQEVRVKAGQHHFQAVKDGVPVRDELISISRGGKQVVKVSLEGALAGAVAPPAAAPGDPAAQAPSGVLRTTATVWTWAGDSAEGVCCGGVTPDGKTLIVGSWGGTVRIFDLEGGKLLKTIAGLSSGQRGLAAAPDGKTFATGAQDRLVRIWDLESGKALRTFDGYSGRIMAVAFSPDGKALASAGGNFGKAGELKIWDLATAKERASVAPFAQDLWDVAWSPDGKRVAAACRDGSAQVVDAATGAVTATFPHSAYARRVAFAPDGKTLAVGYGDQGFVSLWDLETGKQRATFQAQRGALFGLSFSADGKRLLTCGTDGAAVVWNVGKSVEPAFALTGHQGQVCFAAFAPDGKTVVTGGGSDRTVRVWNVGPVDVGQADDRSPAPIAAGPPPADDAAPHTAGPDLKPTSTVAAASASGLSCGALSRDGKTLVTCGWDGSVAIWDVVSAKERKTIPGLNRQARAVAVSPDNQTFAVASDDKVIRLYDLNSGELLVQLTGHHADIHALAFSPDGKTLASAGGDKERHQGGELKLWDFAHPEAPMLSVPLDRPVWDLTYAPRGETVALAMGDGTALIVDAATGKRDAAFSHPQYARRIAYSPDTIVLAVAYGDEGLVTLWNVKQGKEWYTFRAHGKWQRGPLLDLAFSPDGKRLVTCGADGPAMVWDLREAQAQEAFRLTGPKGMSWFGAFSPDGRTVFTGGDDRTIRLWDVGGRH